MVVNERSLDQFVPEAVRQILASPYEFHLTGSRFFGRAGVHSDWDFFVEHSEEVRGWLVDAGFARNYVPVYDADPSVAAIFEKPGCHVQLVQDVGVKLAVQDLIYRQIPSYRGMNKWAQRQLWRALMPLMEETRREAA